MIVDLRLTNLGPMPKTHVSFAPRLNVLTGDNGLGKTLLLDMAWYAMTRTWAEGRMVLPNVGARGRTSIEAEFRGANGRPATVFAEYERLDQRWRWPAGRPFKPGLVVYARIDGGFSIWDPARDYFRAEDRGKKTKPLRLTRSEVWEGQGLCLGLLLDWETWRLSDNGAWKLFREVLDVLSPASGPKFAAERLKPLPAQRLLVEDPKPTPFLAMPYGQVPVTQCSAGMRRILALAYVLVWAWLRHQEDAKLLGEAPTHSIVLLWDEVEAHLHPAWQRVIVPSVMKVVSSILLGTPEADVQLLTTTHAPLVLSSLETICSEERDRLFNLELDEKGHPALTTIGWAKYGDANGWLTSPAMDLPSGYSAAAEAAMTAALNLIARRKAMLHGKTVTKKEVHAELLRTLRDTDPWWRYWMAFYRDAS
jgi:hypothetical protein